MSVLDNIMTGRLLKMRGNVLTEALYWGPASARRWRIAPSSSASSISWRSRR